MLREAEGAIRAEPHRDSPHAIVLADPGWHMGILGIVASKLAERYRRPTALLTVEDGEAKGSLRSADGFPLLGALSELSPLLTRFGGHSQAAGVALPLEHLEAFRAGMVRIARSYAEARGGRPCVEVDGILPLREVTPGLLGEFDRLRPFGVGNEEPLLVSRNLWVERKRPFGGNGQHLRIDLSEGKERYEAVLFHAGPAPVEVGQPVDLLFTPQWSFFRGARSIRLLVRGIRPADGGAE